MFPHRARAGALLTSLAVVAGVLGVRSSASSQAQPPGGAYGSLVELTDAAARATATGVDFTGEWAPRSGTYATNHCYGTLVQNFFITPTY